MKILVLGGTSFVGRHFCEAAQAAGHNLSLFHRGKTNADLFPEAVHLRGDRAGELEALEGGRWTAVIDFSGYLPRDVRATAAVAHGMTAHYTFVSSISVYDGLTEPGQDEDAPLAEMDPDDAGELKWENYGALKVLCEKAATEAMKGNVLLVRPGLIVGPYDPTDRFGYWATRPARSGPILAPGRPERRVQFIDARDLADWLVANVESGTTGAFNTVGPETPIPMGDFLNACLAAHRSDAELVWAPDSVLVEKDVKPFGPEMPLWVPEERNLFMEVSIERSLDAGMHFRPLADTLRDTIEWEESRPRGKRNWMTAKREGELLRAAAKAAKAAKAGAGA